MKTMKKSQPKNIASWIVNNLPENITELTYFEPYADGGNVILNKPQSLFEVLNFIDSSSYKLFKTVRNNCDKLISESQHIPQNRKHFNLLNSDETISEASKELMLRKMSKNSEKTSFFKNKNKTPKFGAIWQTSFSDLQESSRRFKEVIMLNQSAAQIKQLMRFFNDSGVAMVVDPCGVILKRNNEFLLKEQLELLEFLEYFQSKILLVLPCKTSLGKLSSIWNVEKRNNGSKDVILKNY